MKMKTVRMLLSALVLTGTLMGAPRAISAEEITPQRRAKLERARTLVDQGLAALADGRADEAVDLLQKSRDAVPGEAVPAYDHAVALSRAGRMDEALVAYKDALANAPADVRAAVSARARHNLSGIELDLARRAVQMIETPGALEQLVRSQPGPDGEALTDAMADTLVMQLRRKVLDDGLNAAKDAVAILRDTVREDPGAQSAVHNLVLAQRARRRLEAEIEKEQQSQNDEDGDQDKEKDDNQGEEGDEGDQGEQGDEGEDEQDPNAGQDEEQDGEQKPGDDGDSTDADDRSADAQQGEPRDVGKEEAERMLERLLDAAALKARQVEQMRAARLRRGGVEKDW